ncbi:MAG: lipid IV(A) 3-deoxy-D-manno-octulosonic acid transferase [Methylophilus sp.]|jgi:3-deoxy-D-manno-octulosonic-acid transferase
MPHFIYTLLLYLALPFVPLKLFWRGFKQPEYRLHWGERFGFYAAKSSKSIIWLHCVSVGETRAAAPLVNMLLAKYPDHRILITNTTPTGRAASYQLFQNTVLHAYLPYDVPFAVKRFLKHFKPQIGLLMETELWFNLMALCNRNSIPLMLINARLSEKSAKGYAKLGRLAKNGLGKLTLVAAQTTEDENRLRILGAANTTVIGNLKFDVTVPENCQAQGAELRQLIDNGRPIFLAASTREGEEQMILDAISGIDLLTIIVPRHPQRFEEIENLLKTLNINYILRTHITKPINSKIQVVLGNTMGELFTYYAACDFTFVGGSLKKFGGQNLIEAASLGKPILIGKYTHNFAAVSAGAIKSGAATQVKDIENLRDKVLYLISHPEKQEQMSVAALNFSKAKTGATLQVLEYMAPYLAKTNELSD